MQPEDLLMLLNYKMVSQGAVVVNRILFRGRVLVRLEIQRGSVL